MSEGHGNFSLSFFTSLIPLFAQYRLLGVNGLEHDGAVTDILLLLDLDELGLGLFETRDLEVDVRTVVVRGEVGRERIVLRVQERVLVPALPRQ